VNNLPKFHLNPTVNESGNAILRKLHRPGKLVAPDSMKSASGDTYSRKHEKHHFSVTEHHTHRLATTLYRQAVHTVLEKSQIFPAPVKNPKFPNLIQHA